MCRITFDGPLVHIWCERCNSNESILSRWKGWFWLSTSSIARVLVFFFGFYDSTFTIIFPCCWASNFFISVLLKIYIYLSKLHAKNLPLESLLLPFLQLAGYSYPDFLDRAYEYYIQGLWYYNIVSYLDGLQCQYTCNFDFLRHHQIA